MLFSPEIIHCHAGLERDFRHGVKPCSYLGRRQNEKRERQDWIAFPLRSLLRFHVLCQAWFMKKFAEEVHGGGKQLTALSAWVRDLFEAIWRYGVDYRQLAAAGLDGLIIENSAGTVEIEGWNVGESNEMLDRDSLLSAVFTCWFCS